MSVEHERFVYLPLNMSDTRLTRVGFLFRLSFCSM